MSRSIAYSCHDSLKHKLLEHEAIFKNQVYELHRIYGIQRHMMEEIRRHGVHKHSVLIEPSSSSSLQGSQQAIKEATKCDISLFPFPNSGYPRPSKSSANLGNSPSRFSKGNRALSGLLNASASMDYEVLEVRPSKVRKKQFDLQLPADEYIGTEEREPFHSSNNANKSSSPSKGNSRIPAEKPGRLLLNGCADEKFHYQRATAISESCLGNSMRLTDLNKRDEVEDGAVLSSADHLLTSANQGETKGITLSAKSSPDFFGLPKEIKQTALHVSQSKTPDYLSVGNKGYGRYCLSGLEKNNLISIPQEFQHFQLPLCSNQQVGHRSAIFSTNYGGTHLRRDRTDLCLETHDRIHEYSSYNHSNTVMTMKMQPHNAFTPDLSACPRSENFFRSPGSLTQKLTSSNAYSSLNLPANPSKSSHPSTQSCDILGEKWQSNLKSRLNPGSDGLSLMSGFCHGSFSGSEEMLARHTSGGLCVLDSDGSDNAICAPSINHGLEVVLKGTNTMKIMDLNVAHSKGSPIDADFLQDVENINNKSASKGHLTGSSWLTAKPATASGAVNTWRESNSEDFSLFKASPVQVFDPNVSNKDLSTKLKERENYMKKQNDEDNKIKKVLGFPIFHHLPKSLEELSPVSTLVSVHHSHPGVEDETERHRVIDINLVCEEEVASEVLAMEKEIDKKITRFRNHIDLNTCISEEEEPLAISVAPKASCVQTVVDIDLGALVLETEDDVLPGELQQHEGSVKSTSKDEQIQEEVARKGAEAIVSLSYYTHRIEEENVFHPSEDTLAGSLLWFADAVCTCAKETQASKEENDSDELTMMSDGMDDFEVMTLQLQETKEEDYMPCPFVLGAQKIEENDTNLTSIRQQKGNTRRGRQRKNFLKDILTGLTSLSRLEVTEDLQNFEGLMKATGHTWSPGLPTRRNGTRNRSGRGRRRRIADNLSMTVVTADCCTILMDQPTNIEAFLGNYSLKGWGKKTRRPRRQRCPGGNPLA